MEVIVAVPETTAARSEVTTAREVVGLDLGHAETALAKAMTDASTEPKIVDIRGESPLITALAEDQDRGVLIGENAYKVRDPKKLRVAFKSPRLKDPEVRRLTTLYVRRVVDILLEDKQIEGKDDTLFIVGCPSGWDTVTSSDYEAVLKDAGMHRVKVLAESHAAFLAARDSLEVSEEDLAGSVLIVDIGSSTTDFTAVVGLEEKRLDFGSNELGAGILDKIILSAWLDEQDDANLTNLLEQSEQYTSSFLLSCRKVKEEYFKSDNTDEVPAVITKRMVVGGKRYIFDVEISDQDMERILATPIGKGLDRGSDLSRLDWRMAFRKKLEDSRRTMHDVPPGMILLTGGASRMPFVAECCAEIFPDARVKRGSEPQFTIARGLAWAGRQICRAERFQSDIAEIIESGIIQDGVRSKLPDLLPRIAKISFDILVESIVVPTVNEWRSGRISTLNEMSDLMTTRSESVFGDLSQSNAANDIEDAVRLWVEESVHPIVEQSVQNACNAADIDPSHLSIHNDLYLPNIGVDSGDVELSNLDSVGNVVVGIGAAIGATLLGGGGTAIFLAGPIGWIIGLVAAAAVLYIGKEKAMDKARAAKLPLPLRRMAVPETKVRKQMEEKSDELIASIIGSMDNTSFDDFLDQVADAVKGELSEKADRATMLIR